MSSRKMGLSKSGLVGSGRLPAAEAALQPREEVSPSADTYRCRRAPFLAGTPVTTTTTNEDLCT